MNVATGFDHRAYSLREFVEKIRIVDRVHRVEAQAVEAIFVQPVQCVVNEELAYRPAPEVDRRAPRCMATFGEEIRRSGERRGGEEGGSQLRSRGWPEH